jgi:hypothetical protein
MRSLAHELAAQQISTGHRHLSWEAIPGPTRRAVLRRALRRGLLRPVGAPVARGHVAVDDHATRPPTPMKRVEPAR